jgi:hypothetical protein
MTMKFAASRSCANPEAAARKLIEIANFRSASSVERKPVRQPAVKASGRTI